MEHVMTADGRKRRQSGLSVGAPSVIQAGILSGSAGAALRAVSIP